MNQTERAWVQMRRMRMVGFEDARRGRAIWLRRTCFKGPLAAEHRECSNTDTRRFKSLERAGISGSHRLLGRQSIDVSNLDVTRARADALPVDQSKGLNSLRVPQLVAMRSADIETQGGAWPFQVGIGFGKIAASTCTCVHITNQSYTLLLMSLKTTTTTGVCEHAS